ncbi:hypothetical protein [Streptomyces sp. NPDC001380]|uniref:hypothetical protein n=1 Tax=Streptomyces sp. NPDC001380 TaxID=3364566 RepID=UPI00367DED5D
MRRGDRSAGQVARDFDLAGTAVRDRVRQARVDAGEREGLTSAEREEPAALRRENRPGAVPEGRGTTLTSAGSRRRAAGGGRRAG